MNRIKSIAARSYDADGANALVALLGIFTMYSTPGEFPAMLRKKLSLYYEKSKPFAASIGISAVSLRRYAVAVQKSAEIAEETYTDLSKELRKGIKTATANVSIPIELVKFLRAYYSWFSADNENALNYIVKNISVTGDLDIARAFSETEVTVEPTADAQKTVLRETLQHVKKFGFDSVLLDMEQRMKLKTKNPEAYKEYLKLRKTANDVPKQFLQQLVREKGRNNRIDYNVFLKELQAAGIQHSYAKGFVGLIDDQGKIYTTTNVQVNGGISQPGIVVEMNPDYDPKQDNAYVMTITQPTGGVGRIYTVQYRQQKTVEKYDKAGQLDKKIDTVMKKVKANLTNNKPLVRKCATIINVAWETLARIGNEGNKTEGKATAGVSTLKVGHVKQVGKNIKIEFLGKSGVPARYVLAPVDKFMKQTIANIVEFCQDKKSGDYVFSSEKFPGQPISSVVVNKFFKKLGANTTIKYLRTLKGTRLARELLEKAPFEKGAKQADVEKWFKTEMEKVGELLNHKRGVGSNEKITGSTAIQSYIDPNMQKQFFIDLGLRVPTFLQKVK